MLDGFPISKAQTELMEQHNIIPSVAIWLDVSLTMGTTRAAKCQNETKKGYLVLNHMSEIVELKYNKIKPDAKAVQKIFKEKYNCLHSLDGTKNKWCLSYTTIEAIKRNLKIRHVHELFTREGN